MLDIKLELQKISNFHFSKMDRRKKEAILYNVKP